MGLLRFNAKLGACHALEVPFVFDRLDLSAATAMTGERPPQALADVTHRAWVAFAREGSPGWPPYDAGRRLVMRHTEAGGM